MHPRAAELIAQLNLKPHPEGGFYDEVFRASGCVHVPDGRGTRQALTSIYFLLVDGGVSTWHRVISDEVWCFFEGSSLELMSIDPDGTTLNSKFLGHLDGTCTRMCVVPAGCWQAARTLGPYSLVGCQVAPGFDFQDFAMLRDEPELADDLRHRFGRVAEFL